MTSTSSNPGKSLSVSSTPIHSPGPGQSNASASFESTRRPSQASPSVAHSTPRKGQGSRKQHRYQRKPGLRDPNVDEEDSMAEIRAVRNASSRRGQMSITHLLDYAAPHRSYDLGRHHAHSHGAYSRSYRRNPAWGPGSGHHAADKARYVHANYRFVVAPRGNYAAQAVDADKHLDWADVLQVLASAESQQASCPICLSEPVAPRMAKCGHIFCLSCLIRYMNSSPVGENGPGGQGAGGQARQSRWRKCPICEDSVFISEVRPVRFYAGQESTLPRPGEDVVLRLMMRNATSTLALPKEGGAEVLNADEDVPWHFAVDVLDYARIMRGTAGYMEEQFDREVEDLQKQEKEDELLFHESCEWTQKAIKAIGAAREKLQDLGETEIVASSSTAAVSTQSRHAEQDFYFFTSPPHLYLSPLDIRILKTKYGSFSAFPSTLLPRVEHISTGHVVDDAMRRRAKYLGHLPQGCLISFLECDWTDIVPAETLESFAEEIERRRKRNHDKAAQEERERLQAERIEAAAIRDARRNLTGTVDDDVVVRFGTSPPSDAPVDLEDFQPLGSGAQSSTPPNPRTGFAQLADVSTSPSTQRTVWGTRVVAGSPELGPVTRQPANDDGWLKDDQVLETLGTAELATQMEAFGFEAPENASGAESVPASTAGGRGVGGGPAGGGGGGGGGGKKKKKQKITLMSTGGRRGA